jgi:hypothetical protein
VGGDRVSRPDRVGVDLPGRTHTYPIGCGVTAIDAAIVSLLTASSRAPLSPTLGIVRALTTTLVGSRRGAETRTMVSPGVIAGFAAIGASVVGQFLYVIYSYERHRHEDAHAPQHRES